MRGWEVVEMPAGLLEAGQKVLRPPKPHPNLTPSLALILVLALAASSPNPHRNPHRTLAAPSPRPHALVSTGGAAHGGARLPQPLGAGGRHRHRLVPLAEGEFVIRHC